MKSVHLKTTLGILCVAGLVTLGGCTPMMAGQMAEAGYNVARTSLGVTANPTTLGADERQKRLQAVLNSVDIGQEVKPVIDGMGEPPKEKSGNSAGFTCYEYPAVYSAEEAAVIVATDGKVVFYGNSRCTLEMQPSNFAQGGKYSVSTVPMQ